MPLTRLTPVREPPEQEDEMMSKFSVAVQYRSVRTVIVQAKDSSAAANIAAKRVERSGHEVIACGVTQIVSEDE